MARLFNSGTYLAILIWIAGCSAPGPILPTKEAPAASPALYEMDALQHRFKNNVAAFLQIFPGGRTELWQLSLSSTGKIHLFQYIGHSYDGNEIEFRAQKCFLHAKDTPDSDLVALEVFTCDHLIVELQPADCTGCLITTRGPYGDELTDASDFLLDRHLTPLSSTRYTGKKMDAFSDPTQVWYWGLSRERKPATGTTTPAGTVKTVLDGFVQIEPGPGPDRISIPLPEPSSDLF